ncbi:UNVERIFIED_CONTAM: response regulator [Comamonas sp. A-3]|nr:response regulator [Comamonas thiooxydans]
MKKILIVEDHADIRKLIRMTLEIRDFEVQEVATGDEAWEVTQRTKPDVVLLDVMTPGTLSGLEVCQLIKDSDDLRDTQVIMLTARGSADDRQAGLNAGADEYLVKPFSTLKLLEVIESLERSI